MAHCFLSQGVEESKRQKRDSETGNILTGLQNVLAFSPFNFLLDVAETYPQNLCVDQQSGVGSMSDFYSEPIEVCVQGSIQRPVSFCWQGKEYTILEIWAEWQDAGFGPIKPGRGKWWQRRHRNYYRVVTDTTEIFEIYLDRRKQRKQWYLYRKVEMDRQ